MCTGRTSGTSPVLSPIRTTRKPTAAATRPPLASCSSESVEASITPAEAPLTGRTQIGSGHDIIVSEETTPARSNIPDGSSLLGLACIRTLHPDPSCRGTQVQQQQRQPALTVLIGTFLMSLADPKPCLALLMALIVFCMNNDRVSYLLAN